MDKNQLVSLKQNIGSWQPPTLPVNIPHGDMPGDKVEITQSHIDKANLIFPLLVPMAAAVAEKTGKVVISVCGGSGVGKSETASLLSHYFRSVGVGSYTLSGDNYPRRIPMYNDAERIRVFRTAGLRGLLEEKVYTSEAAEKLKQLWEQETDADPIMAKTYSWLNVYQKAGKEALAMYLGTDLEQDYQELNSIIAAFKSGATSLWLKRMGRTEDQRWYDAVDMSGIQVLIIEWTHGNNDALLGVDIPVLLNSTPEETRVHRRSRNRDGKTDSAFTTMVLEIEQQELDNCAHKAKLIISKNGQVLSYAQYRSLMDGQGG